MIEYKKTRKQNHILFHGMKNDAVAQFTQKLQDSAKLIVLFLGIKNKYIYQNVKLLIH